MAISARGTGSAPRHALRCPGCGLLDQLQRVSAVYKIGTATARGSAWTRGSFWGYGRGGALWGAIQATTAIEEDHATELSEVLAPPARPVLRDTWGLVSTLLVIAMLLSGWMAMMEASGLHCAPGGQRTVCGDGQGSMFTASPAGTTPDPAEFARWTQVGLMALPVGLLTGLVLLRWRLGVRRRRQFQADYAAWEQLQAWWERLVSCHRCDGVFAPGERQLHAPADWDTYGLVQAAL